MLMECSCCCLMTAEGWMNWISIVLFSWLNRIELITSFLIGGWIVIHSFIHFCKINRWQTAPARTIEANHENFNEDRPIGYYQRQRRSVIVCSFWQYKVYADIRWGFIGAEASNDSGLSGVIENVDFQGFRTLRIRHLMKWGQHYYITPIRNRIE